MNSRFFILIVIAMMLGGCVNADEKIVDLSGGVFLVFISLIAIKYLSPAIIKSTLFGKLTSLINAHLHRFTYPLYVLAILLIAAGFFFSEIHRVHIFSGLVIGVIAHNVGLLTKRETEEQKKTPIEIISLGLGILVVLFLLWSMGADIFREFSIF